MIELHDLAWAELGVADQLLQKGVAVQPPKGQAKGAGSHQNGNAVPVQTSRRHHGREQG